MTPIILLFVAFCIAFSAAMATDIHRWTPDTYIQIKPTSVPGAEAEVVFLNTSIHPLPTETFVINLDGLEVEVLFERDVEGISDSFTVTPPPGFIAIPQELVVPENGVGRILIIEGGLS